MIVLCMTRVFDLKQAFVGDTYRERMMLVQYIH